MIILKKNISKILLLFSIVLIALGTIGYYYINSPGIVDFTNTPEQHEFVNKLFKDNWHWLVSENVVDFSPDYMMNNRSIRQLAGSGNKSILKMKIYNDWYKEPVGFLVYYYPYPDKYNYKNALLLFLGVDKDRRKKGYARELLNYAINDLKVHGCTSVELDTRITNVSAKKLYKSLGFYPTKDDKIFVNLKKFLL